MKDSDSLCKLSSVVFDGQLFSIGDIIVVRLANDEYVFELIEFVLSFEGAIYFLYENLETINYHLHYNSYQVIKTDNFSLCSGNQLMDYHPISMCNVLNKNFVTLKHYIHTPVDDRFLYVSFCNLFPFKVVPVISFYLAK